MYKRTDKWNGPHNNLGAHELDTHALKLIILFQCSQYFLGTVLINEKLKEEWDKKQVHMFPIHFLLHGNRTAFCEIWGSQSSECQDYGVIR